MWRHTDGSVRPDEVAKAQEAGVVWADLFYWDGRTYYSFTQDEMKLIGRATARLYQMIMQAANYVVEQNDPTLWQRFGISQRAAAAITEIWKDPTDYPEGQERYWPFMYARLDLCPIRGIDGHLTGVKLYEANATPTTLVEAACAQWDWLEHNHPHRDQWNQLDELLIKAWAREITQVRTYGRKVDIVHFAYDDRDASGEDEMTVTYMATMAQEASDLLVKQGHKPITVKIVKLSSITQTEMRNLPIDPSDPQSGYQGYFTVDDGDDLEMVFHIFPWEKILAGKYGQTALWNMVQDEFFAGDKNRKGTLWIEPIYKLLFNKALLPILWMLFKGTPDEHLLLEAYAKGAEPPGFADNAAEKAIDGREGKGTILKKNGQLLARRDGYGDAGYILQKLQLPPEFDDGRYPVIGAWLVGDTAAGMGIREGGLITDGDATFVRHILLP